MLIDPMADPTVMPIEQKKLMGLWPPSADNIADSLYPYIKRMKKEKVSILDVGTGLGENAYRFFELDKENGKIGGYVTLDIPLNIPASPETTKSNLEGLGVEFVPAGVDIGNSLFDVVFINADLKPLDKCMVKYYDNCDHHGIYCGNNHHTTHVKEALSKFRRGKKIGTPISISNRLCWFWWKR